MFDDLQRNRWLSTEWEVRSRFLMSQQCLTCFWKQTSTKISRYSEVLFFLLETIRIQLGRNYSHAFLKQLKESLLLLWFKYDTFFYMSENLITLKDYIAEVWGWDFRCQGLSLWPFYEGKLLNWPFLWRLPLSNMSIYM